MAIFSRTFRSGLLLGLFAALIVAVGAFIALDRYDTQTLKRTVKRGAVKKHQKDYGEIVARLIDASSNHRVARMRYFSASNNREKEYVVHPHHVAYFDGGLYLTAMVPEYGQVRHFAGRASGEWDLILVPSEECEAYYREQYGYTGAVLAAGYRAPTRWSTPTRRRYAATCSPGSAYPRTARSCSTRRRTATR